MKPILDIQREELFEIKDDEQIEMMKHCLKPLRKYDNDCKKDDYRACTFIDANRGYINMFFWVVDYLYQYYEFSQRHFALLDLAATHLESLSKKNRLLTETEQAEARSELGDYLDKVTLIFQTAADKAADKRLRKTYAAKAQEYSRKADAAHHVVSTQSYNEKILSLYGKVISERPEGSFIKGVLKKRAAEYQRKCEAKETPEARTASFSSSGETEAAEEVSDTTPLLSSHRESAGGLRRRTVRREEERPTSSPSPS